MGRVETSGIARARRGRLTSRALIDGLLKQGVLVGITGAGRNLLKVRPPMIFSRRILTSWSMRWSGHFG
ncbi:MAG: hypothetical protein DI537_08115 [Stutzerimonas stutzeri]|uniref:Uncharacterized protein n=1 Tax=Bosea eneae TaxID=151454 RepID=A0ABW0INF7_9HYPH|nr:MAG: hypothetical protein DI537_08115 [Stutzerimonas stutzeri]